MSLAMTRDERETFLAELHAGVMGIARDGQAPLCVPIWYDFSPKPIVHRYFGTEFGDWYFEENASERRDVFTLRPERWRTVDYAKLAAAPGS